MFYYFWKRWFTNLAGAMFIPSSSVFRFLPSLLTIFIFSEIVKIKIKILPIYFFNFTFNKSTLSFESVVFVIFDKFIYLLKLIISLLDQKI